MPRAQSARNEFSPAGWIDAKPGMPHTATDPEPLLLLQDGDPIWHDLRDDSGRPQLGTLRVWQYRPVQTTGSDWKPLIASGKGATLLARRDLGRGRIFASGLAFTPRESSLPLKAGFVVLVQNAVFGDRLRADCRCASIHAGDEFALAARAPSPSSRWPAARSPGRAPARDFAGFPRAGVYEIRQPDRVEWVAASRRSRRGAARFPAARSRPAPAQPAA